MKIEKIAVLTSSDSWFVPFAKRLLIILNQRKYKAKLYFNHSKIKEHFDVVFILSYFHTIEDKFIKRFKYNLVVHESDLPQGRGWAPLFWQILQGKNKIPIVLFNINTQIDSGPVFIKDHLFFTGSELYEEIRKKQALKTIDICLNFLKKYQVLNSIKQSGKISYFRKRTPLDSELDINMSIKDQFNLLRIVNNDSFPAFFKYKKNKYIIKIYKQDDKSD